MPQNHSLAFSLHFLFQCDQNRYSNLTSKIMKMFEDLKKHRTSETKLNDKMTIAPQLNALGHNHCFLFFFNQKFIRSDKKNLLKNELLNHFALERRLSFRHLEKISSQNLFSSTKLNYIRNLSELSEIINCSNSIFHKEGAL